MHRLLQGDVGSGKTVVAALAALRCIEAGWQCALMAPTEILAEQHFRKLVGWLEPLGLHTAWLTGSQRASERRAALAAAESGQAHLVVGTHAVIEDKVQFSKLGLVVIDEQHRFGVAQRLTLRRKTTRDENGRDLEPHLLMMSATPIPRTLAMSYYADLDVSTIDELPPGRSPIVTKVVDEARREQIVERLGCALVRHMQQLDPGPDFQQLARQMIGAPGAVRGKAQRLGIALGERDDVIDRLDRHRRMRHQHKLLTHHLGDRRKILQHIKRDVPVQTRVGGHGRCRDQQGVTIRPCLGGCGCAHVASGAGAVFHHKRLPRLLG
jgi:hypothetical protein